MKINPNTLLLALTNFDIRACREFKFHPNRKWHSDFALPGLKILIECEGGIFPSKKRGGKRGAHGSVTGILRDIEKYNEATKLGYRVLRYTPDKIGNCYSDIEQLIKNKNG